MCKKCNKTEALKYLDQLVSQYAPQIAALFEYYGVSAPVTVLTVSDMITVYKDQFIDDLYMATIAPENQSANPYEGTLLQAAYEGNQFQANAITDEFFDLVKKANEVINNADAMLNPEEDPDDGENSKKDVAGKGQILGMDTSDFVLVAAIALVIIALIALR